jgi:hypothetical protein
MNGTLEGVSKPRKPPTESVRLDKDVARDARILAAALDVSMPDLLSQVLRPMIEAKMKEAGVSVSRRKPSKS